MIDTYHTYKKWTNPDVLLPGKGYWLKSAGIYEITLTPGKDSADLHHLEVIEMYDWLSKDEKGTAEFVLEGPAQLTVDGVGVYNLKIRPGPHSNAPLRVPGNVLIAFDDSAGYAPVPPALLVYGEGRGWYDPFNLGPEEWTQAAAQDLQDLLIGLVVPVPDNVINLALGTLLGKEQIDPPDLFKDEKRYDVVSAPLGGDGALPASEATVTFTLAFGEPGLHHIHLWAAIVRGSFIPSSYGTYHYEFDVEVR